MNKTIVWKLIKLLKRENVKKKNVKTINDMRGILENKMLDTFEAISSKTKQHSSLNLFKINLFSLNIFR